MVVFVRSLAMLVAMPFASEGSDSEGAAMPRFNSVPTYDASPLQPAPRGFAAELAVWVAHVMAETVAAVPPANAVVPSVSTERAVQRAETRARTSTEGVTL
jgi:hypothetical protein